ncbi:retrovirus-related pol polyprotein from transposon TNT 1-94 [Tanacetum coccineum]|uniref:Retrovirus-related pol polyprotein from transposon TNT 1-94 n=1 Tax=Tanacetum coccineum TaxID=301880 RepID=A0ABQ4ZGB5_9ASTR
MEIPFKVLASTGGGRAKGPKDTLYLKKKLYTYYMSLGTKLGDQIDDFNKLILDLANIDIEIGGEDQALMLLTLLPSSYKNFVETLLYGRESLTIENVLAILNSKESKKKTKGTKEEISNGLYVRGKSNHSGKSHSGGSLRFKSRGGTGKLKSFICHSKGHLKRVCLMKKSSGFIWKGKHDQDYDSSNYEENAYCGEALVVIRNDEMTENVIDSGNEANKEDSKGPVEATNMENFNASAQNHLILNLDSFKSLLVDWHSWCSGLPPENSKWSDLVSEDLEQLHDDDLEEMDLKWNMTLLSMRAKKFYQRTGKCRAPRSNRPTEIGIKEAIKDSDSGRVEIQANMALNVDTHNLRFINFRKHHIKYKESGVLFSEEIALLKRSVGHKEYLMGLLKTELEKVKEEKEGFEFKIAKFEKSSKDLDDLLASQLMKKDLWIVDCSCIMTGNIAHLQISKDFDGGICNFVCGGANGGRITGKGTIKTDKLDFEDVYFVKELKTKDETSEILMNFIKEIENLVDKKVKIIRSDNGTEFKNNAMDEFCREKEGNGPKWMFDLDSLTQSMNYVPVVAGTFSNVSAEKNGTADQQVNTASPEVNTGSREVSTAVPEINTATPEDLMGPIPTTEDTQVEDQEIELGEYFTILSSFFCLSTHHTRNSQRVIQRTCDCDVQSIVKQEEDNSTTELTCLKGHRAIGQSRDYRNKKDERGIVIKNKARLVAQGHTQEEGIDYDEVFAPVARIEQYEYSMAYASYMVFTV